MRNSMPEAVELSFFAQTRHGIDECHGMRRSTRQPEVDPARIQPRAVDGLALGEQTARAGLGAAYDQYLRLGYGTVADVESLGHILGYGARQHQSVGMAGRGGKRS